MSTDAALSRNWIIKSVPSDVWRIVFGLYVAKNHENLPEFASRGGPFVLIQVCSIWRSITIGAPELWRNITVHIDCNGRTSPTVNLLSLSLRCASTSQLNMRLVLCDGHTISAPDLQSAAVFLRGAHRARHLEINSRSLQHLFFNLEAGKDIELTAEGAPWLEELVLSTVRNSLVAIPTFTPFIVQLWNRAPRLNTIIVRGNIRFDRSWTTLIQISFFPFDHLTTIELDTSISVEEFFSILSVTRKLVHCMFHKIIGELSSHEPGEPLFLPLLQSLDLGGNGFEFYPDFASTHALTKLLSHIKAPALMSLRLCRDRDWSLSSFKTFIHHSSCQILHLAWDIECSRETEKLECLQLLPSLRSFRIHSKRTYESGHPDLLTKVFMDALRDWDVSKQEFKLCPQLESLGIDYDALENPTSTVFADMVEIRWRRSVRSKDFTVVVLGVQSEEEEDMSNLPLELIRLLVLKRDGLGLTLDPVPSRLEAAICR